MIRIKHSVRGSTASILRQVALSVTATLIATAILTGLHQEFGPSRSAASTPLLTSGGKFAARIDGLAADADESDPILLPRSQIPLLMSDAGGLSAPRALAIEDIPAPMSGTRRAEAVRPLKRLVRLESRKRPLAERGRDLLPPRRGDYVPATPLTSEPVEVVSDASPARLWSITKVVMKQAVWLGGSVLDRITPTGLFP